MLIIDASPLLLPRDNARFALDIDMLFDYALMLCPARAADMLFRATYFTPCFSLTPLHACCCRYAGVTLPLLRLAACRYEARHT